MSLVFRRCGMARTNATLARGFAVGFRVVALVGERCARRDVGAEVELRLEISAGARLANGQVGGDRQAVEIGLEMDLG